jgi:HEAT repeat protein
MSGNAGIEALRELLKVLRITEHDTYRVTLLGLTGDKDPRVRVEAYRGYLPTKTEEIDGLFENLERENDESVREKIIEALIRTRYWEVIDRIFKVVEKNWHLRKYTLPLVKFCGDNKIVGAVPYLGKMIFKREIFGSAKSDELKCAAVVSLGLIRSPEAVENLKKAAVSDNEAIKRMCAIVLRSDSYV